MAATTTITAAITNVVLVACGRCLGKGYLEGFTHVHGGVCFRCAGSGQTRISAAAHGRAQREAAALAARAAEAVRVQAERREAEHDAIDWTNSVPCRYSSDACFEGRCSSCIDGYTPDISRNNHLRH